MKILILGGTRFLGRHLTTSALERNHEVTLFNRGNYKPPTDVESIIGDRKLDLDKLKHRSWDAVIDTSGHLPRDVNAAAKALADSVELYIFISSQSVYADVSEVGVAENAPVKTVTQEQLAHAESLDSSSNSSAVNYGQLYGGLKALCEQVAEEAMPGRVLNIRPGLIVGPDDYSDRFTYWVVRANRGGEVLAPAPPDRPIQFIDVRDLADWIIRMSEAKQSGVYNANGLPDRVTMKTFLEECSLASSSKVLFTWVSEKFLIDEQVAAWSELPLWLPVEIAPQLKGFMFIDTSKAVAKGLAFRPLEVTVKDTLTWYMAKHSDLSGDLNAGLNGNREQLLLEKWRGESPTSSTTTTAS